MPRLIVVFAFLAFSISATPAQQVIAKGSWKLEDNGTPFTIWGSYSSAKACQEAYPGILANAKEQLAQAKAALDAENNSSDYNPMVGNADLETWTQLNDIEQAIEGAVCIQQ